MFRLQCSRVSTAARQEKRRQRKNTLESLKWLILISTQDFYLAAHALAAFSRIVAHMKTCKPNTKQCGPKSKSCMPLLAPIDAIRPNERRLHCMQSSLCNSHLIRSVNVQHFFSFSISFCCCLYRFDIVSLDALTRAPSTHKQIDCNGSVEANLECVCAVFCFSIVYSVPHFRYLTYPQSHTTQPRHQAADTLYILRGKTDIFSALLFCSSRAPYLAN